MIISIQDSPMYGGFRFNKEPITSTHKCIKTHKYIRTTGKEFVEEYVLGRWEESYTITNEEVLQTNRRGYIKLFKTGIDKSICNFVQWVLKSDYRIS